MTKERQLLTKEEFIQKCANSGVTLYCDYRDKLTDKQVLQLIKEGYIDIDPPDVSDKESGKDTLFEELRRVHYPRPQELSDDEIRECLDSMYCGWDIPQLIRNTGLINIHFQWVSNYDCINSHWFETQRNGSNGYSFGETYMSQVLELLRISPATFVEMERAAGFNPTGRFDTRKETPLVDPQTFWDMECVERSAPASLFAIIGTLDLRDITQGKPPTKFVIPKGNTVGFYSSTEGGISQFDTPLLADFEIDITERSEHGDGWILTFESKESVYYTMDNIAGLCQSFWKNKVKVIYEK